MRDPQRRNRTICYPSLDTKTPYIGRVEVRWYAEFLAYIDGAQLTGWPIINRHERARVHTGVLVRCIQAFEVDGEALVNMVTTPDHSEESRLVFTGRILKEFQLDADAEGCGIDRGHGGSVVAIYRPAAAEFKGRSC